MTESPKKGFSLKDVMNNSEAKELSVIVGVYSIIPTQKALSFLRDKSETEKVKKILYALSKEDMLNEVRTFLPKAAGRSGQIGAGSSPAAQAPREARMTLATAVCCYAAEANWQPRQNLLSDNDPGW